MKDYIDYGVLVDEAMHFVVRKTLNLVQEHGLPEDHHFFITFETTHPGVMISDELREKYEEEMTIVVQHQFWDLEVTEEYFSIVLSFDAVKQNLTIPFDALISFADPSVKFGLQFQHEPIDSGSEPSDSDVPMSDMDVEIDNDKGLVEGSNVITLDNFRKK